MKKHASLAIAFSVSTSCTTLKQLSNQTIESKIGCSDITLEQNKMLINVEVDNQKQVFLFDTGATLSVITDTTAVENYYKKEKGNFGSMKGADRKSTALLTITSKINSELFFSESKIFANLMQSETKCQKKETYKGIIGLDAVFSDEAPIVIDFSNKKLCNITSDEKKNLLKLGYSRIKSECDSRKVFVFFTIEGKEYRFKLDTGFYGNIIIPFNRQIDLSQYNSFTYEGSLLKTINSITNGEETYYENIPVSTANVNFATKVHVSKTVKAQNIGLNFMKSFDWIIDFKNNEVYLKRNHLDADAFFSATIMEYFSSEKEGKLLVSSKLKNAVKYNIGDEIISVNDQKVTPENICEMQSLLNKTLDWQTLNVEVVSSNKTQSH